MFDDLFKYIFTQLEVSPPATFRESELNKSKESFDRLVKEGFLVFDHYDKDGDSYFSDRQGDRDYERYIRKRGDKILAQAVENDVKTIELSKEEIAYYRFNLDILLKRIKDQNGLSGKSDCNFSSRIFYVGTHPASNTAVLLGFLEDEAELLSLWSKIEKHDHALIICPSFVITAQDLLNKLDHQSIQCRSFTEIFKTDDFVIDSDIFQKFRKSKNSVEITKSERAGYNSFHYKRKDILEFTDEEIGHRSYVIKVNGEKIPNGISYAELILLMFLAMKLKEGSGGWVSAEEIAKEEITGMSITHLHRLVSDLKKKIAPYLESSSEELIENIKGKSQYRISTHPSRVKTPSTHWLRQKYRIIKGEVLKERQRRSK